jgi:hypothetical protein
MELTKDKQEYFENNRNGVLEHMKNKSNKHHIYTQKLEQLDSFIILVLENVRTILSRINGIRY